MTEERDILDVARSYDERARESGIAKVRAELVAVEPTEICTGCGEEIPEERRNAVRANLCTRCKTIEERRRAQHGRR